MCFPTTTKQAKILETLLAKLSAPQALSRVLFCFCLEGVTEGNVLFWGLGLWIDIDRVWYTLQ